MSSENVSYASVAASPSSDVSVAWTDAGAVGDVD